MMTEHLRIDLGDLHHLIAYLCPPRTVQKETNIHGFFHPECLASVYRDAVPFCSINQNVRICNLTPNSREAIK